MADRLERLEPGMPIVYGGDRITTVGADLAAKFNGGDMLIVVQDDGALLHVPKEDRAAVEKAIDAAVQAFAGFGLVNMSHFVEFYELAAGRLDDDAIFARVKGANDEDVEAAKRRGRSTSRLVLDESMRVSMGQGLNTWASRKPQSDDPPEVIERDGWELRHVVSGLGVVGFVFEGRPNVLIDALGLLAAGNSIVFRIGSDALRTARALMTHVIVPALQTAGLPEGSVSLVDARSHAAGWALFSDPRLGLAVARGSGAAVSQLGAVARQSGTPVSLHGTGGAWIIASETAGGRELEHAVRNSLDRKVCNTVNTVCVVASRAEELVPVVLDALDQAGKKRSVVSKLHVTDEAVDLIPPHWFDEAEISRAVGNVMEPRTETISSDQLGREWEWEDSPELTLTLIPDVETGISLFNTQSPRFIASLISSDDDEHSMFFETIEAPFVGDGFTRWVDGQYALEKPELGLTNWQYGRLMARGGILSGDSVFTLRIRARVKDIELHR